MIHKKMEEKLEWVPCVWYFVIFKNSTKDLLDSESEVNAISQVFAHQLGFKIWKINGGAQKIDGTTLKSIK